MTCKEGQMAIIKSIESELSLDKAQILQKHLEQCSPCRKNYDHQMLLENLLSSEVVPAIPDGLQDRIITRLHSHQLKGFRRELARLAAAALLMGLLLGTSRLEALWSQIKALASIPSRTNMEKVITEPIHQATLFSSETIENLLNSDH